MAILQSLISQSTDIYREDAIDFQYNNKLPKLLEQAINNFRTNGNSKRQFAKDYISALRSTIGFKNIKVIFEDKPMMSSVMLPVIVPKLVMHTIYEKYAEEIAEIVKKEEPYKRLRKGLEQVVGTVDLVNNKVTGIYQDVPFIFFYSVDMLSGSSENGLSVAVDEMTAIMLHEIGHAMSYLEKIERDTVSNFMIDDAVEKLFNERSPQRKVAIYKGITEATGIEASPIALDAIKRQALTKDGYRKLLISEEYKKAYSQIQDSKELLTRRVSEQEADVYVTRFGYHTQLATVLRRKYVFNELFYTIAQISRIIVYIDVALVLLSGLSFTPLGWLIVVSTDLILILSGISHKDEYDEPKRRLERLRLEVSNAAKDKRQPPAIREYLLDSYKKITKLIDSLGPFTKGSYGISNIVLYLIRGDKSRKEEDLQHLLEDLTNNPLYTAAQAFKQQ